MSEAELLEAAISLLTRRLPARWSVEKTAMGGDEEPGDLVIKDPGGTGTAILVEARREFAPRDLENLMGRLWKRFRKQTGNRPILIVAPYLSPRTRERLVEENISYLDLTGNSWIALDYPGVFVSSEGAQRDPAGGRRSRGLRGAKVGAVIRVLVDVCPPLTGADIARAADVNEGYVSRILDTLLDEGLIERASPGPVTEVDWPALIRRRGRALDLFKTIGTYRYVAREGAERILKELAERPADGSPVVTGSFAAQRWAPVASPVTLVLYSMTPRELAAELDLLPVDTGADTILVRPDNDVVFARAKLDGGLLWAAQSQVAIDCLAGGGRMPAEGEALIDWMQANEKQWRYASIEALSGATDGTRAES